MNNRIVQLDSIRGIAALSVFFGHIYNATPDLPAIRFAPWKVLINGHSAVIMFFILSGFVLSLPYFYGSKPPYPLFAAKRISRIYFPYVIAIVLAFLMDNLISTGGIAGLSSWFNATWPEHVNVSMLAEHLFLIGNIHTDTLDSVVWSLVHELRISLVFPLIIFLVNRLHWMKVVIVCFALSFVGGLNGWMHFQESNGYFTSYFDSVHYTSMFLIGSLIAKYKDQIIEKVNQVPKSYKYGMLILAFLTYNYSVLSILNKIVPNSFAVKYSEYPIAIGASLFMIVALTSHKTFKVLMLKPVHFLGKISYSFYLYHVIVLLSLLYLLYGFMPLWMIYTVALILSIVVSTIAWYLVEKPSMAFGKTLSNWYKMRRNVTINQTRREGI